MTHEVTLSEFQKVLGHYFEDNRGTFLDDELDECLDDEDFKKDQAARDNLRIQLHQMNYFQRKVPIELVKLEIELARLKTKSKLSPDEEKRKKQLESKLWLIDNFDFGPRPPASLFM